MNRTNIVLAIIAVAALLVTLSAQTNRTTPSAAGQTGRYQLLNGEYNVVTTDGSNLILKRVFRIDTVTGETSFYSVVLPDPPKIPKYISEWNPISEYLK